jgi:hypothetical protein
MTPSGTRMVPVYVGETETTNPAHLSLNEVLDIAAEHQTDPVCLSLGPLKGSTATPVFAALVAAQDASGRTKAIWTSEPMFGSAEAAQEHAQEVIGTELWPLLFCGAEAGNPGL